MISGAIERLDVELFGSNTKTNFSFNLIYKDTDGNTETLVMYSNGDRHLHVASADNDDNRVAILRHLSYSTITKRGNASWIHFHRYNPGIIISESDKAKIQEKTQSELLTFHQAFCLWAGLQRVTDSLSTSIYSYPFADIGLPKGDVYLNE